MLDLVSVNLPSEIQDILKDTKDKLNKVSIPKKRCLRCGKALTTPESCIRGYGDECYKKVLKQRWQKNRLI